MTKELLIDYCPFCCVNHVIGECPCEGETKQQYWKRMQDLVEDDVQDQRRKNVKTKKKLI